jgi:hypothetical protein
VKDSGFVLVAASGSWRLRLVQKRPFFRAFQDYSGLLPQSPSRYKQDNPMSKHDSVTKRQRRPKSDKRIDYTITNDGGYQATLGNSEVE